MDQPKRPQSHIISTRSAKYLENNIPDEWHFNVPANDYGIDYQVEISKNGQVTGLNFSLQLKSTEETGKGNFAKVTLKHTTLNYYQVRLEPIMLIIYDAEHNEAYWSWLSDHRIDLTSDKKNYSLRISKENKLSEIDWNGIASHVQKLFNAKSFISDFDILQIENNLELGAWKVYYQEDYEQAVYLFRRLIREGSVSYNIHQALAWSLYQTYQYNDALSTINLVIESSETPNSLKIKACILTEFGFATQDKGKLIQARNIFKEFLTGEDSAVMLYNYANALNSLGEFREAIVQYRLSIKKDPNEARCWKNLGTTYYNLGEHDKEMACYDKALALNPELPQALFSKGITLAQHFAKHDEALVLFHKVLSEKNNLAQEYVNGLFWVAYCYEQIGDIDKALFWVDKGLSFNGSSIYFLNFKSNLLGREWRNTAKLKEIAISFFKYRVELDNDPKSWHQLAIIHNWDLSQILSNVSAKFGLYKDLNYNVLAQLGFTKEDLQNTLSFMEYYKPFRDKYPTSRYISNIISPYFSITAEFFNLLELAFAVAFNQALISYRTDNNEINIVNSLTGTMLRFMPVLIKYYLPEEKITDADTNEVILSCFPGYTDMIYREIGVQSGHITVNLNLRKIDPVEYISEEYQDQLGEAIYNNFIKYLN
ncbi:DUF4365 domain-containing protein [Mucilaginibacter conchicola]|uniref:DUF4365 domain-containing protein n=1 Tax=Mucilaginibacter conchicola TaxID=2303333 RepID=A0A372NMV1_9SPHI|nr:DUF4365 domain-containing protein [Mucilaginibacter conchicola]RFZ90281.1 DUF4365 domain-containing protein [Mucilaginibacter conchicola]